MGRATDNHVVLYSAVVSRRHVELHRNGSGWEIVNLGANGTFIDGERVNKLQASDGLIIRLARSGPSIQVGLEVNLDAVSASPSMDASSYSSAPSENSFDENVAPDLAIPSAFQSLNNGNGMVFDAPTPELPLEVGFSHQTIISEESDTPVYDEPASTPDSLVPPTQPPGFFTAEQPPTGEGFNYAQEGQVIAPSASDQYSGNVRFAEPAVESHPFNSHNPDAFRVGADFIGTGIPEPSRSGFEAGLESEAFSASPSANPIESSAVFTGEEQVAFQSQPQDSPFAFSPTGLQTPIIESQEPSLSFFTPSKAEPTVIPSSVQGGGAYPGSTPANVISFSLETGQPLEVQQTIGRYQVVKTIVHSNHNITYLAWRDGRSMTLKTLNANWSDYTQACAALEEEARVFHKLRHPGLPQLIDFFWVDGQPFLAREMIFGKNLEQYVATHGPISTAKALGWVIQVCDVLSYLHQQTPALLHYDVKPRNIIHRATPQGSWEVSLVGLQLSTSLTEAGTQMGFPAYTAPEQQEGRAMPSSDLYSLGPVLVYLLTGQEPELFYRYINNEYRLVAGEVPGLSQPIAQLIHTLTELKIEFRYASAKDVSRMIQQILNNQSSMGTRL